MCFSHELLISFGNLFIMYQSSIKFSFSCVSLVESVSREIDEIKLSPSHQRERETMHYSPVNNEKNHVRHHVNTPPLDSRKLRMLFRKLIKYFKYLCTKFALFFRWLDSWYIIKYLLTETSGKQYCIVNVDVSRGEADRNFDSLGSTIHTVSLGLCQ